MAGGCARIAEQELATLPTPEPICRNRSGQNRSGRPFDTFEITLLTGYVVENLPPAANADYPLLPVITSKTEVNGNVLRYTRSMEVKQLAGRSTRLRTSSAFIRSSMATNETRRCSSPPWLYKQVVSGIRLTRLRYDPR